MWTRNDLESIRCHDLTTNATSWSVSMRIQVGGLCSELEIFGDADGSSKQTVSRS
jgi:hypothetical protein